MSTESAKTIKRQWYIIRYLLRGNYVSTSEIKKFLYDLGVDVDLRTIQRDLKILQGVFPLECRDDSKPHSWRWKRIQSTTMTEVDLSRALVLCLIKQYLTDIFTPQLIKELEPLFEKADVIVGMAAEDNLSEEKLNIQPKNVLPRKMLSGSSSVGIAQKIADWVNQAINIETAKPKTTHQIFLRLADALIELDLAEMAVDFK